MPDDLRQLVEGQLHLASRAERDVLDAASVVGVTFDAQAVAAGLVAEPADVESLCDRLARSHRWLHELGSREWPDGALAGRYAFTHALYQRVLYNRLSPSRRVTLHRRIGECLEAGYAGRTAEVVSELATHFQCSQDRARAVMCLGHAASRGYERRAYRDVVACLEPALRLFQDLPETPERARDEVRLRQLYSVVLSQTAGYTADGLLENLMRTRTLCERLADPAALFDVLNALGVLYGSRGDCAAAEQAGRELSHLAEGLETSAVLRADYLRGAAALWSGDLRAAEEPLAACCPRLRRRKTRAHCTGSIPSSALAPTKACGGGSAASRIGRARCNGRPSHWPTVSAAPSRSPTP